MRATHSRAKILARAAQRSTGASPSTAPVSRNLAARVATPVKEYGFTGTRRHGNKTKYSGSGDKGYASEWSRSLDFWTDPKWSATVSDVTA